MSRNTNRHPCNHLGGVNNEKEKSVWTENFLFNPSRGTWLSERIWYARFFLVSGGYQGSHSWLKIFQLSDIADNMKETTACWSGRQGSRKGQETDSQPPAQLPLWALLLLSNPDMFFLSLHCRSRDNNDASLLQCSLRLSIYLCWRKL